MWRILRQAVGLVLRNLGAALRVSVGPLVLLATLTQGTGWLMRGGLFDGGTLLLLGLLSGLILSWVAVAWHRYVLREETPTGVLPPTAGPETFQHMGWAFLHGMGSLILGWALAPMLDLLFAPLVESSTPGDVLAGLGPTVTLLLLTSYLGLRLGLVLPAAALGRSMTLQDSWQTTRPLSGTILGLTVLGLLALALSGAIAPVLMGTLLTGTLGELLAYADPMLWAYLAVAAALNWLAMMLGLSILTTLYGHLVERRPL